MGCCCSVSSRPLSKRKDQAKMNLTDEGFGWLTIMERHFRLPAKHIREFHQHFLAIDQFSAGKEHNEGDHKVTLQEWINYFDLENTEFTRRAFSVMDKNGNGEIDFPEFVMTLYHYCTFDWHGLVDFAFDMADANENHQLSMDEVHALVKFVYGRNILDETTEQVLQKADKNHSGGLSRLEFHAYSRKFQVLLFPAFHIQDVLREAVGGHKFWDREAHKLRDRASPLCLGEQQTVLDVFEKLLVKMREEEGWGPPGPDNYGALGNVASDAASGVAREASVRKNDGSVQDWVHTKQKNYDYDRYVAEGVNAGRGKARKKSKHAKKLKKARGDSAGALGKNSDISKDVEQLVAQNKVKGRKRRKSRAVGGAKNKVHISDERGTFGNATAQESSKLDRISKSLAR